MLILSCGRFWSRISCVTFHLSWSGVIPQHYGLPLRGIYLAYSVGLHDISKASIQSLRVVSFVVSSILLSCPSRPHTQAMVYWTNLSFGIGVYLNFWVFRLHFWLYLQREIFFIISAVASGLLYDFLCFGSCGVLVLVAFVYNHFLFGVPGQGKVLRASSQGQEGADQAARGA